MKKMSKFDIACLVIQVCNVVKWISIVSILLLLITFVWIQMVILLQVLLTLVLILCLVLVVAEKMEDVRW